MKLYSLILSLFLLPLWAVGQCPSSISDFSSNFGQPAGTNIGVETDVACTALPVASFTINGETYSDGFFCSSTDPNYRIFSTAGTPQDISSGATVSYGGAIGDCEYDMAGALILEIPTLSEWGLLILALLLMTMGTLYLIDNKELARQE